MKVIPTNLLFFANGFTLTPNIILVQPSYINNISLIEHEKVHAKQMIDEGGVLIFYFKYVFSRKFRLEKEAEAYATSIKFKYPTTESDKEIYLDIYGDLLSKEYFLGKTKEECKESIRGWL